jgi:xylulose-5-phosphate/fructose-6-phosphate phosphoketolase
MLNELDRYHLAGDAIDRVARLRVRAGHHKQLIRDRLIEHREYIEANGDDPPGIKDWKWLARS